MSYDASSQDATLDVVCAADDAYAMPLAVTLKSACRNLAEGYRIRLFLLSGGISDKNFAMIESTLKNESIDINLPQAVPPKPQDNDDDKPVTLQVSDNGNYYWNQELITLPEIGYRLGNYVDDEPNPRVLLASDDLAKYEDVIRALDIVRSVDRENPNKVQVSFETVYRPTGR